MIHKRCISLLLLLLLQHLATTTSFVPRHRVFVPNPSQTRQQQDSIVLLRTKELNDDDEDDDDDNTNGSSSKKTRRERLASFLQQPDDMRPTVSEWAVTARRPDIEAGQRYRSRDWLINILSLPNSFVLKRIKFHLVSNTLLSLLVVLVDRYWVRLGIPVLAHTLVGSFLGLLLVFRTDSAYTRFWQARHYWTKTKETCRNLAITASTQLKYHSPKSATRLLELLIAFPEALCYTCLCGAMPLTNRLKRILPARLQNDPAICLCLMMQQELLAAAQESPSSGLNIVEARYHMEASSFIQTLMDTTTHCEMIVRTPVPWSYSRHTSRFLTVWCGTLPFALVQSFGWLTLPAVMVVSWCLFGIEEIGHLIEQPFVSDDVVVSQRFLSKSDRMELKAKAYDLGIPVEQLAWLISGQVVEIAYAASQLPEIPLADVTVDDEQLAS
ncbi:UPF0187 protein [Seminavis robusta]|uniref:UPF0187 protein n=1 Tax=Seminavis robusta TaxID=568900 RepID=A0A9N8ELM3_9STRA|nr:UPF0187 protein [Seminavis robusta]|eukprot:Sro1409_g270140.1 UPF0187 protein (441) ;mRNA; r:4249-5805